MIWRSWSVQIGGRHDYSPTAPTGRPRPHHTPRAQLGEGRGDAEGDEMNRKALRALLEEERRISARIHAQRRAVQIEISKEERSEMGALTKITRTLDGNPAREFMDQIIQFLAEEKERSRIDPDPLIGAKALIAAKRTLIILARNGYPKLLPLLYEVQLGVDAIAKLFRRELVRRLLLDTIPEPKAAEGMQVLSGLIDAGQWPDWRQDWDEVEDQVCAKLAAKTGTLHTTRGGPLASSI
jgi:hypothetical protein